VDDINLEEDLLRMKAAHRDALCAAIVLSAAGPLDADTQDALMALGTRIGLPPELADDLRLRVAGGVVSIDELPEEPIAIGSEARNLSARVLLLGIRAGGRCETTACALASRLGTSDARMPRLLTAIRSGAGSHPLDDTGVQASVDEYLRAPSFLRKMLGDDGPARKRVGSIAPTRYRHPLDVQATKALAGTLAFEDAARKLSEMLPERVWRALNAAGRIRVGPDQFPELYETYRRCCQRLDIYPEPPLFLNRGGFNAMTTGIEQPFVIVNDLLVGILPQRELEFVIGHELGHIKFDHVLNLTIAQLLKVPGTVLDHIPIVGPLIKTGIDLAMFEWLRKAELSCDRAGLLCCQDPQAGFRVMMRMAGAPALYAAEFNIAAFIRQYEDLQGHQKDLLTRGFYALSTATRSHPWAAVRAYELNKWIEEGHYASLLSECTPEGGPVSPPPASVSQRAHRCPTCTVRVPAGLTQCMACPTEVTPQDALIQCGSCESEVEPGHRFCEVCGAPVQPDEACEEGA
jgi:Zn-dependent protease with chaperone function